VAGIVCFYQVNNPILVYLHSAIYNNMSLMMLVNITDEVAKEYMPRKVLHGEDLALTSDLLKNL